MKITKNILKKIIREEINQAQQEASPQGTPEKTGQETAGSLQALRKELINAAKSLTGIHAQELPFIKVALSVIQKAKEGNVNTGALKTHLAMVQKDLEQIK